MLNMAKPLHDAGFTLLEVLITIVILVFGLLGLAGLQGRATIADMESYQRSQALILAKDMHDRINANRASASSYNNVQAGTGASPTCPGGGIAEKDICDWHNALLGASVKLGSNSIGSMIGARGCISYDAASELPVGGAGTGIYSVAVAWQGMAPTLVPTNSTCGQGQYGANDAIRRVVVTQFRIGNLSLVSP